MSHLQLVRSFNEPKPQYKSSTSEQPFMCSVTLTQEEHADRSEWNLACRIELANSWRPSLATISVRSISWVMNRLDHMANQTAKFAACITNFVVQPRVHY